MPVEGVASRVLVIDDHREVLEAVQRMLETWGYEVDGAANGTSGLTAFFARPPDVVVLDLVLPDIKACEMIGEMRAALQDVFIVAYSGYQELLPLALVAGANGSVLKPNVEGLKDVLRLEGVLGAWRRRRRDQTLQ